MGNKPPPLQKLTNHENSVKSICAEARFSFLVVEPQMTIYKPPKLMPTFEHFFLPMKGWATP